MNSINLVGRITKDLELRYTNNDKPVCEFNLAVNRTFTNQNGEREADFITCQAWNGQAENLTKYQGKGSLIGVVGSLRVNKFQDKDGNDRYKTFVLVNNIEFLGTKKETTEQPVEKPITEQTKQSDPFAEFGEEIALTDDDLPF